MKKGRGKGRILPKVFSFMGSSLKSASYLTLLPFHFLIPSNPNELTSDLIVTSSPYASALLELLAYLPTQQDPGPTTYNHRCYSAKGWTFSTAKPHFIRKEREFRPPAPFPAMMLSLWPIASMTNVSLALPIPVLCKHLHSISPSFYTHCYS